MQEKNAKEPKETDLQDSIDVLEVILGNEEGIKYIVNRAFNELPQNGGAKCLGRDLHYMVANVMEVWKHIIKLRITQDFVAYVLGHEVEGPECSYGAEEFKGFIIKVFVALRTMLVEKLARMKQDVAATTECTEP